MFHPDLPRLLNIAELKRIGSFPDGYKLSDDWDTALMRIGNSVPPLLMRAIANHIKDEILPGCKDTGIEPRGAT